VQEIEAVAGYRPAAGQIVKFSHETTHSQYGNYPVRTLAVPYVIAIHRLALAGR
jgi:hypothetical protein